jgi:hypothetical protein
MAEDKFEETDDGYYVQSGDIREWHYKKGHEPELKVPEGEFDPRDVKLVESEPKVVTTKTAAAVVPPKKAEPTKGKSK